MEWIDGRTLRDVLTDGPLAAEAAVSTAYEIADGLAAAHEKGIVRRDLKPENIMLRADGRAKIPDFGLARSTIVETMEASASDPDLTPRVTPGAGTVEGAILGTVGYMSPEQAAGRPADFHSDQFMLGLILYELLAGRRARWRASAAPSSRKIRSERLIEGIFLNSRRPSPVSLSPRRGEGDGSPGSSQALYEGRWLDASSVLFLGTRARSSGSNLRISASRTGCRRDRDSGMDGCSSRRDRGRAPCLSMDR